jgi:hypothetical protein
VRWLGTFYRFWYEFLVGDDWLVAAGVVITLALGAVLVRADLVAWWWLPVAVAFLLAASLWRATRGSS